MLRSWKGIVGVGVSLALVLVLLATACAPAKPVEEENKVKIGLSCLFTGPLASTGAPLSWGLIDYLRYVNDELGGVEYRTPEGKTKRIKLDYAYEDNGYNVPRTLTIYKRQKAAGVKAMYLTAGSITEGVLGLLTRDHMPVIYNVPASLLCMRARPLYTTAEETNYVDLTCGFAEWVKQNWKLKRAPVLGIITLDSAMARGYLTDPSLPAYLTKIGVDFAGLEFVPFGATDTTIELTRLGAKDPDWIFIHHIASGAVIVLKDAARVGLREKAEFVICTYGFEESLLDLAPEAVEGVYGEVGGAFGHEDLAGMRLVKEITTKYRPGAEAGYVRSKGIALGQCWVEGIRLALENVGYENLTGEAINEGLHSIANFDTGGIYPPLTIDPEYPVLCPYERVAMIEAGKIKVVSEWVKMPAVFR